MKLNEMSDESCLRWIAEKQGWQVYQYESNPPVILNNHGTACEQWPDFVNDPMMWSTLLEQLINDGNEVTFIPSSDRSFIAVYVEGAYGHNPAKTSSSKLGRGVCEVWMLANGWTE